MFNIIKILKQNNTISRKLRLCNMFKKFRLSQAKYDIKTTRRLCDKKIKQIYLEVECEKNSNFTPKPKSKTSVGGNYKFKYLLPMEVFQTWVSFF